MCGLGQSENKKINSYIKGLITMPTDGDITFITPGGRGRVEVEEKEAELNTGNVELIVQTNVRLGD